MCANICVSEFYLVFILHISWNFQKKLIKFLKTVDHLLKTYFFEKLAFKKDAV